MARSSAYAAIDVGSTKVCAVVGDIARSGDVEIIGVGVAATRGLRKGVVVNIDETAQSVQAAVEKAERSSGTKIVSAHVGVSGNHVSSLNNKGIVAISHADRLITSEDVMRVLEAARTVNIPSNREILHIIPRSYTLDGQEGVQNPVGMHGFRLDVETHIITGAVTSIQNLTKCIRGVGVEVEDLVLQPLASAEAVLTKDEREMGVVLADIGGGTTDIAVFVDGSVWHTAILPVGGYHISNDVAVALRTPFPTAEDLKAKHGHAMPDMVDPNDTIEVKAFGVETSRRLSRRELSAVIHARCQEILEMVALEIKRSGYDSLLPAGLVLTGGVANLEGIADLARETVQLPVRIGVPHGITGLIETLTNPAYATAAGLLLWSVNHAEVAAEETRGIPFGGIGKRFAFWVRELLPQ